MGAFGSRPVGDDPLRDRPGWRSNLVLGFCTLLILATIGVSLQAGSRSLRVFLPLIRNVDAVRFHSAEAQLALEEAIDGHGSRSVERAHQNLEAAESSLNHIQTVVERGELYRADPRDLDRFVSNARESVIALRDEIRRELEERAENEAVHAPYERHDRSHEDILEACGALNLELERLMNRTQSRFVGLQVGLMLVGLGLSLVLGFLFYRHRRRERVALRSLAAGEARLQALSDASFEAIFISREGVCLDQNRSAERMFGYSRDEALGRMGSDWIVPEDRELVRRNMRQGETNPYRVNALRKDGSAFPAMIQGRMEEQEDGPPIRVTALRDISSQREAEAELHHLFDQAPVAIWREDFSALKAYIDEKTASGVDDWRQHLAIHPQQVAELAGLIKVLDVNQAAVEMHEAVDKEQLLSSVSATFTEKSLSGFCEEILGFLAGESIVEIEGTVQSLKGKQLDVLARTFLDPEVRDWSKVYVAITDLTEAKRIESERAHAEKDRDRLAAAIEQVPQFVLITNTDGEIVYVNPGFEATTGYSREEALGKNPRILSSGVHDRAFFEQLWTTLIEGRTWKGRLVNRHRDGTLYTEEAVISPVTNNAGEIVNYVAVKQDITREIKLEAQLLQSQKLEAVGQLAGGVAHDFNNILQAILGYADFAMTDLEPGSQRWRDIEEIRTNSNRASKLTRQLLAFSRQQASAPVCQDLNALIQALLNMLKRLFGEEIRIEFTPDPEPVLVFADGGQIEQVLLNLCLNARDAMPEGGRIGIRTGDGHPSVEPSTENGEAQVANWVRIEVSDDGDGMSPGTMDRAFEPYFTTKAVGKGSGLGLSTVFGIIDQHDGTIELSSEPGVGTVARVFLPRIRPGSETLLLVEGEEGGSGEIKRCLVSMGHRVIGVDGAKTALDEIERTTDEIDLLIVDTAVPEKKYENIKNELMELAPGLEILYLRGHGAETHGGTPSPTRKLRDQYQVIREALDGSPRDRSSEQET